MRRLSSEMKQEQIEACTLPRISLDELAQDFAARRVSADSTARAAGARSVALATSPFPVTSTAAPGERIERMMQKFGVTAAEQLTCGCHAHIKEMLRAGAPLDRAQIYLDARLRHHHPTVEIRVADVCLITDDAVLLAVLVRGLAETAARQRCAGVPLVPASAVQLRLVSWQAGRFGLTDPPLLASEQSF